MDLQYTELHCYLSVHACVSISFVFENKCRHSPLFVRAISYMCTRQSRFASKFYYHSNHFFTSEPTAWLLACSFVPAAGLHSFPQAFPAISCSLSCKAHCWTAAGAEHFITAACREKQTQTGSSAKGSRRPLLGWDIPRNGWLRSEHLYKVAYIFIQI